jgi:hypothetical protein
MLGVCLKYMMRNYGSQLQARATIQIFEDYGLDYEILNYTKKGILFKIKNLHRIFNPVIIDNLLLSRQKKKALRSVPQITERNALFDRYSKQHFANKTIKIDYYCDLQKIANKYEAIITCSDQLWSPAALGTNFYDLMFVPNNIRKISLASSFGVSQLLPSQKKKTKRFLDRIEYISMRENEGAGIVKELTGRDVPVLLDPVFFYNKEEWDKIVPTEKIIPFPYVLCYFLGDNVEYRKRVKEFAARNEIKIVAISFCNSYIEYDKTFGDIIPFDVDPDKFLNLLRGASFVCTDSFHGAAFSIIMQKQFVIFNRYTEGTIISRNSRISSLCENLDIKECRGNEQSDLSELFSKEINYESVENKILYYKGKMIDYLNKAFAGLN